MSYTTERIELYNKPEGRAGNSDGYRVLVRKKGDGTGEPIWSVAHRGKSSLSEREAMGMATTLMENPNIDVLIGTGLIRTTEDGKSHVFILLDPAYKDVQVIPVKL